MSSVDTRSNASLFTVLLVTDAAATCQAFTLQVAGETFCLPEAQAIAALLERRPADLVVLAASESTGREIKQTLDGRHNLVTLEATGEVSASVRLALETGDAGSLLRALAQAISQVPPAPAPGVQPVLPPSNGGNEEDEQAPAQPAMPAAPAVEGNRVADPAPPARAPAAPATEPAPSGHSAALLEMEDRLERVLNRRLGP